MKIRAIRNLNGNLELGDEALFKQWMTTNEGLIWLDIEGDDPQQVRDLLSAIGAHDLSIADALRLRHPPKIESFEDYTFILYRGILSINDELEYKPCQLACFVQERLLVTYHRYTVKSIEAHMESSKLAAVFSSPALLAVDIMAQSAGYYVKAVLDFEAHLSELEDSLDEAVDDSLLASITNYKSRLSKLKRIFNYHANLGTALKSGECNYFPVEDEALMHTIHSLHERFERVYSLLAMYYEICGDLIDGYLSITSHRMNLAMRVLTVITAIFVPLSFMAGLYGMNFENMPELKFRYSYYVLLAAMVVTASALLMVFRRKRWL